MHRLIILALALLIFVEPCSARRLMPEFVQPVIFGDTKYLAPHVTPKYDEEHGHPACPIGCIEAWDIKTESLLWRVQVYEIDFHRYDDEEIIIEGDVLADYISSLKIKQENLLIETERGKKFLVNLKTKAVQNQ